MVLKLIKYCFVFDLFFYLELSSHFTLTTSLRNTDY